MVPLHSPLRYPGGKRRLVSLAAAILNENRLRPGLLVEPFCGGASVAVGLLQQNLVDKIALADADPLIGAFWKIVFSEDAVTLAQWVRTVRVSLKAWDRWHKAEPSDEMELAQKCIFLNRTSFSGILQQAAGPLGGRTQQSEHKINCRFPSDRLADRILELARLRDRVLFVQTQCYLETFEQIRQMQLPGHLFWYLDPPFYHKGEKLYRRAFRHDDHVALAIEIDRIPGDWLLSYDDAPEIRVIHHAHAHKPLGMIYSSRRGDLVEDRKLPLGKELIFSSLPITNFAYEPNSKLVRWGVITGEGKPAITAVRSRSRSAEGTAKGMPSLKRRTG